MQGRVQMTLPPTATSAAAACRPGQPRSLRLASSPTAAPSWRAPPAPGVLADAVGPDAKGPAWRRGAVPCRPRLLILSNLFPTGRVLSQRLTSPPEAFPAAAAVWARVRAEMEDPTPPPAASLPAVWQQTRRLWASSKAQTADVNTLIMVRA